MTIISACAVGSLSSRVRFPALAITIPSRTSAAPIGASPRSAAERASAKARLIGSSLFSPTKSTLPTRPCPLAVRPSVFRWLPQHSGLGQAAERGNVDADEPEQTRMNDETQAEGSEVREGQRIAKAMARAGVGSRRDPAAAIAGARGGL